jgi:hypothetical protein
MVTATNGQAVAQVIATPPGGYTYNVGGGLLFSPAEMSLAGMEEDKMGSGFDTELDDFDKHFGYNAFFSVGKQIDNNWDVRFGGSINKLLDSTGSLTWSSGFSFSGGTPGVDFSSYSYGTSGSNSGREAFGFAALDFEVGYTPVLTETQSVRLFAGIRGLHFLGDSDRAFEASTFSSSFSDTVLGIGSSFNSFSISATESTKTEFFGAGPRIGVSAAHRFEGTNFGLSGTVAGALLFGRQTTTSTDTFSYSGFSSYSIPNGPSGTYSISGGSSYSDFSSVNKLVVDLEAKGGLDYYLDDRTALTIGYRAELLKNIGPDDDWEAKKLVHGPFLSLTGSFD